MSDLLKNHQIINKYDTLLKKYLKKYVKKKEIISDKAKIELYFNCKKDSDTYPIDLSGTYVLKINEDFISRFSIRTLHGCCGVCVSHKAEVFPAWRNIGFGTSLHRFRLHVAKVDKYGLMLCTNLLEQKNNEKILLKVGWKKTSSFLNPRTYNAVDTYVFDLKDFNVSEVDSK